MSGATGERVIPIKLISEESIRHLRFKRRQGVEGLFRMVGRTVSPPFSRPSLTWLDDEGDHISIKIDHDLDEAFRLLRPGGTLNIYIDESIATPKTTSCALGCQPLKCSADDHIIDDDTGVICHTEIERPTDQINSSYKTSKSQLEDADNQVGRGTHAYMDETIGLEDARTQHVHEGHQRDIRMTRKRPHKYLLETATSLKNIIAKGCVTNPSISSKQANKRPHKYLLETATSLKNTIAKECVTNPSISSKQADIDYQRDRFPFPHALSTLTTEYPSMNIEVVKEVLISNSGDQQSTSDVLQDMHGWLVEESDSLPSSTYTMQLDDLKSMGFSHFHTDLLSDLLVEHGGNVSAVVDALLFKLL